MKAVWFNDKHSYFDFNLVLKSKEIPLPEAKTYLVDVPCADGQLDLSTALTGGKIKYKNRQIKMIFTSMASWNQLEQIKSIIANYLHGKVMKVIFDSDNEFFYEGRCSIVSFKTDVYPAELEVDVDAEPYKYKLDKTKKSFHVSGSKTLTIENQKMDTIPVINVSADMTLTYKSRQYSLTAGDNVIVDIVLSNKSSDNTLVFNGTGDVVISYQEGEL